MAIEVEQDKKSVNIVGIMVGVLIVALVFAGIYFLLFKRPEIIDVVLPSDLLDLGDISSISFEPEKVFELDKFKALRQYGSKVVVTGKGKSNPFLR